MGKWLGGHLDIDYVSYQLVCWASTDGSKPLPNKRRNYQPTGYTGGRNTFDCYIQVKLAIKLLCNGKRYTIWAVKKFEICWGFFFHACIVFVMLCVEILGWYFQMPLLGDLQVYNFWRHLATKWQNILNFSFKCIWGALIWATLSKNTMTRFCGKSFLN